jgi:ribosomal protein L11 methyltransferase
VKWLELSTVVDIEAVESVSDVLAQYGHNGGVAIEEAFVVSDDGMSHTIDPTKPVIIRTYLPNDPSADQKRREIEVALWHLGQMRSVQPLQVIERDEDEWADAWKKHLHPTHIGERFVVKPSWHDYTPCCGEIIIELDPGMAFGTGLHPTTQMCLGALETTGVSSESRVLDLGTGSGILAIAAAKLGARDIVALDIDSTAVRVARENVLRNGMAHRIVVDEGSVDITLEGANSRLSAPFDLVLANIISQVLISLADNLYHSVKPGGLLVASGIISDRADAVTEAFCSAGLVIQRADTLGDWVTLLARRVG